tara:strand:- start:19624 stop:19890 length:267 start_codon:yes stop_codon:yes gene_type:complete
MSVWIGAGIIILLYVVMYVYFRYNQWKSDEFFDFIDEHQGYVIDKEWFKYTLYHKYPWTMKTLIFLTFTLFILTLLLTIRILSINGVW